MVNRHDIGKHGGTLYKGIIVVGDDIEMGDVCKSHDRCLTRRMRIFRRGNAFFDTIAKHFLKYEHALIGQRKAGERQLARIRNVRCGTR